jgi:preprotein translocase subunit SecB
MSEQDGQAGQEGQDEQAQFSLQRIYIKDVSFESPRSPDAFVGQWKPTVNLDLNSHHKVVGTDLYEVVLNVTVTVKKEDGDVVYLSEVQQAGIFMIRGMNEEGFAQTLGSFCPSVLFPYAREAIDALVIKGSFPPLMLAPVNFDAIFAQSRQQQLDTNSASATPPVVN